MPDVTLVWVDVLPSRARLLFGGSFGADRSYFYLGGIDTLRGYNYEALVGTRIGLVNLEVRIPLIDALHFGWPVRWTLGGIRGILFADLGGAWSDWQYGSEDPFNIFVREGNGIRLDDAKAAVGIGMRLKTRSVFSRLRRSRDIQTSPRLEPGFKYHFVPRPKRFNSLQPSARASTPFSAVSKEKKRLFEACVFADGNRWLMANGYRKPSARWLLVIGCWLLVIRGF